MVERRNNLSGSELREAVCIYPKLHIGPRMESSEELASDKKGVTDYDLTE